jgi:hypothetical protein
MRQHLTAKSLWLVVCLLSMSVSGRAHHGAALSFDTTHMWTTWGTVEEFNYINPHPAMKFARTVKNGDTEHWAGEMANNVGQLARLGWTKSRSVAALKPGTRVKLYLATAVTGGFTAYVQLVESETGELLVSAREETIPAVDMDGVPGGYQPKAQDK